MEVACTRSAVELLGTFRVTAGGRMLQRYGVLEEAGRESAAVWSRRPAMVEKEAGIGERGKTEKKITHLPFDRRFLVSFHCDGG